MTEKLLLPYKYKKLGWLLLIPATVLGIFITVANFEIKWLHFKTFAVISDEILLKPTYFNLFETNMTLTVVGSMFILGALLVGFSKEKREDEFIAKLRLSSLLWAVWLNYVLLFLALLFIYGTPFITIMIYNMFTVLIIFIVRFNFILYKTTQAALHEK